MSFRTAAAAWLVAQCEPLVPTLSRAVVDEAFHEETRQNPTRTAWWFAGVVTDLVSTLPPNDPWRNLSARVGVLTRGVVPKPPTDTGASGPNGPFGTVVDGHDLVHPSFADPSTDIGLAALSSGISATGAAILAFGADGWRSAGVATLAALDEMMQAPGVDDPAAAFAEAGADALRWAAWRRRAYVGPGDEMTLASGFAWLWRAEELAAHGDLPAEEWAQAQALVDGESIDPGTYEVFTSGG